MKEGGGGGQMSFVRAQSFSSALPEVTCTGMGRGTEGLVARVKGGGGLAV